MHLRDATMTRAGIQPRYRGAQRLRTLVFVAVPLVWLAFVSVPDSARAALVSDLNSDGVVDVNDLAIFSQDELGQDWQTVDWCAWLEGPYRHGKHVRQLLDFIDAYFRCSEEDPLVIRNANGFPTRVAWAPDAQKLYVSDARIGSVFVYDSVLQLLGEMRVGGKPLGVAVDLNGNVFVGNDASDDVTVYNPDGIPLTSFGGETLGMPNDLAFDASGKLYVADSQHKRVWIFDPASGENLGHIGAGQLRFPVSLAISGTELFVADQSNFQVKVFDLQGNLLRSLGTKVSQGSLGYKWKGKFIRVQGLAIDSLGRLHVLDSHMGRIQILNAANGGYIAYYGTHGSDPGELDLPLDIDLNSFGETAVANTRNQRVELLTPP
jgi:DNA-binding beta-propeller fold protein YncE